MMIPVQGTIPHVNIFFCKVYEMRSLDGTPRSSFFVVCEVGPAESSRRARSEFGIISGKASADVFVAGVNHAEVY
jgi:hypothetical protein